MNARKARQRKQERRRYHQEQSQLPADEQETRFRLGQLRRERDIKLAQVALEQNLAIAEITAAAAEQRTQIQDEYRERFKVVNGKKPGRSLVKEAVEQARRLGIAIPTDEEMRQVVKEQTGS